VDRAFKHKAIHVTLGVEKFSARAPVNLRLSRQVDRTERTISETIVGKSWALNPSKSTASQIDRTSRIRGIVLATDIDGGGGRLTYSLLFSFAPKFHPQLRAGARLRILFEENQMKRVELSDLSSNLLLLSSVMVALIPLVLGDRLVLVAQNGLQELTVFFNEMSTFVIKALS
jgi:hypothetical protein